MTHVPVIPPGSAPPLAPYSPGVCVDNARRVVHVSGMLALDADGAVVGVGDVRAQTRCVLEAIRSVVEAAGGSLADIAMNQIFLKDLADYAAFNEVYREYFPVNPPARYCIRADLVKPAFLVEVAATAYLSE
ncbi:MAG: pyrimidine utilization protein C [Rhodocyclaceae bacterium]|nr:pyrimidine utilization protein C [Rhodocyclaceae bacterium]MCA3074374.1 pyrimidine utilization protein C [Rhodocyclaceae bacterium]MCA3090781.1 pyrimidine utilization protein C [Rhodocyclaceae bacterium]MCA3095540.1 pyrimidine utilization protein C [Rhodocyclaceae bacterium]MCA3097547.1 pyrimidine utilization protein C [Rhodocyclaceae bacterium]